MFDIGFSELLLFGVIALIVLGPEKMPQAARTAGQWYAKMRRMVSTLQSEIEAELDLAETRQQMQDEIAKIRETEAEMKREMAEMRGSMHEFEQSQNQSLNTMFQSDSNTSQGEKNADRQEPSAATPSLTKQTPAEFSYDYQSQASSAAPSTTDDNINDNEHLQLDENGAAIDPTQAKTTFDDSAAPASPTVTNIVTKPWENMWFRLGSYDKARRLPPAPYLPNYQADILLYTQANASNHHAQSGHAAANEVDK